MLQVRPRRAEDRAWVSLWGGDILAPCRAPPWGSWTLPCGLREDMKLHDLMSLHPLKTGPAK